MTRFRTERVYNNLGLVSECIVVDHNRPIPSYGEPHRRLRAVPVAADADGCAGPGRWLGSRMVGVGTERSLGVEAHFIALIARAFR